MRAGYTVDRGAFVAEKPQLWSQKSLVTQAFGPYDLAPDGKRFVVLMYSGGTAEDQKPIDTVTVLLNFFDELKRHVALRGQ
jgi:hypothetical protein